MHELWIEVDRVDGACSGPVPMTPGTGFLVRGGRLHVPGGGPICLFALQSLLPLLPAKERLTDDDPSVDWLGRIRHAQCPDPAGRVQWRIDQRPVGETTVGPARSPTPQPGDLRVTVARIDGRCNEGTRVGDAALMRGSSLYVAQPFCLYALATLLPLLAAKGREQDPGDWMHETVDAVCPDPLGNVIFRIKRVDEAAA